MYVCIYINSIDYGRVKLALGFLMPIIPVTVRFFTRKPGNPGKKYFFPGIFARGIILFSPGKNYPGNFFLPG